MMLLVSNHEWTYRIIFAMRARYQNQTGTEALFNEADSAFSAQNDDYGVTQGDYTGGSDSGASVGFGCSKWFKPLRSRCCWWIWHFYNVGQGIPTADAEDLEMVLVISSTRWHSASRRLLLLLSPEGPSNTVLRTSTRPQGNPRSKC